LGSQDFLELSDPAFNVDLEKKQGDDINAADEKQHICFLLTAMHTITLVGSFVLYM